MKISQSLIKEVQNVNHCPKQIYYSFVEGKDLIEPTEAMLMGRYFESELLGSCRGGEKQPATYNQVNLKPNKSASKPVKIKFLQDRGINTVGMSVIELDEKLQYEPAEYVKGEKHKPYLDCDELVTFARETMLNMGLDFSKGQSQVNIESDTLSGAIDHVNIDLEGNNSIYANYDVKWTATKEDDRWNGWGDPDSKEDAKIQATHYTLVTYETTGVWRPFYFLVFGKDKWVKVLKFKVTLERINQHRQQIANTVDVIRKYAENNYKGNGNFNKCQSCAFNQLCPDKKTIPEIETITI